MIRHEWPKLLYIIRREVVRKKRKIVAIKAFSFLLLNSIFLRHLHIRVHLSPLSLDWCLKKLKYEIGLKYYYEVARRRIREKAPWRILHRHYIGSQAKDDSLRIFHQTQIGNSINISAGLRSTWSYTNTFFEERMQSSGITTFCRERRKESRTNAGPNVW